MSTTTPTPTYPHIIYVPDATNQQVFVPETTIPPDPPDPTPTTDPSVEFIDQSGHRITMLAKDGEQLDSFVDPSSQFIQQCWLCTHVELEGYRAYYRPDANSSREEWVFEWGDPWVTAPTDNALPHTVIITDKQGNKHTVDVTKGHYWFARWRWQSSPRAVRRTYQQLASLNLICNLDTTGLASGPILTVSDYEPMATCGMPANQGQTGGYPGLGILTGWQAQYLVRRAPEHEWRAQGEAAGSFQAHVRDTHTHAPIDIVTDYPNANTYAASTGNPYIGKGKLINRTDQGHMPSAAYLPWLLTGDPYYLEECQFWANHNMLSLPGNSTRFMVAGRYLAWPLRAIYECLLTTPDTVPNWLLPKSYWQHWLNVCKKFVTDRMVNNSDPYFYVFHTIPDYGQTSNTDPNKSGDHVWQQNMLDLVAAWVATTRDDWVEPAEWLIRSSIDRASSTSGWCRARPSPYHMRLQNCSVITEAMTTASATVKVAYAQMWRTGDVVQIDSELLTLGTSSNNGLTWSVAKRTKPSNHSLNAVVYGPKCVSWMEATQLNIFTYGWSDTDDNNHLSPQTTDLTYPSYQRCALAQALHAGLSTPGLQEAYDWLDAEMRRLVSEKRLQVGDNWCVMPRPATIARRPHRAVDSSPSDWVLVDELRGDD